MLNPSLFQDPGVIYPMGNDDLPFANYSSQCRNIVQKTRIDLQDNPLANRIIDANSPFEMQPSSSPTSGALLIHGLLDCPFMMKDIGLHLQSEGLLVRSILLPGHGTVPGALLNVHVNDWIQTVQYGIASLAKEVDRIFLVGFSTGGTLALHHVLQHPNPAIAGLILLAPAIQLYSHWGFAATWPRCIDWAWPRAKWLHINEPNDYAKYQSIPFHAAAQLYHLIQQIKELSKTRQPSCPLLLVVSQHDKTIRSQAAINYFLHDASADSQLIIYTQQDSIKNSRIIYRPITYPEWNIVDISHQAIPIAPNNIHYGKQGDYVNASHANKNLPRKNKFIYGSLNNFEKMYSNLAYRLGLSHHQLAQLTFNPDFAFLAEAISRFVM